MDTIQFSQEAEDMLELLGITTERNDEIVALQQTLLNKYIRISFADRNGDIGTQTEIDANSGQMLQDIYDGFKPTTPAETLWVGFVAASFIKRVTEIVAKLSFEAALTGADMDDQSSGPEADSIREGVEAIRKSRSSAGRGARGLSSLLELMRGGL